MRNLIILLFYFCFSLALQANSTNPNAPFETANINKTEELLCTLPAPANIYFPYSAAINHTTSIAVAWSNVANAVNFNVGTFVSATGAFVSNTVVTTTSTTITSLSPGTCYTFYVSAGCGGGAFSTNTISGERCTDFVVDLIANGYQNCTPSQDVIIDAPVGSPTEIDNLDNATVYAGVIKQTNPPSSLYQKNIRFLISSGHVTMQQVAVAPSLFELGTLASANCIEDASGLFQSLVLDCPQIVEHCSIIFRKGSNGRNKMSIKDENTSNTYSISIYRTTCSHGRSTTMDDISLANEITVAPNPFNNEFNLIIPGIEDLDQSVSIQLFDMNGKICHAQELAPRTALGVINIPTSDLPTGIYFLRARVGDTVKTIKVMKSDQ